MSIILDENHIDPLQDPVQKALEAFVEAARQSDKPYTLDSLTEMVRGELLQEAGGVFSWLKRCTRASGSSGSAATTTTS